MSANENPRPLSRRTMLTAGTAALATAGTVALPAIASVEPDRSAFAEAFAVYMAASAENDAAQAAEEAAAERLEAMGDYPDIPEAVWFREGDFTELRLPTPKGRHGPDGVDFYDARQCADFRARPRTKAVPYPHPDMPPPNMVVRQEPWPEAQARADEIVAAWDAYEAECDRLRRESGLEAAGERWSAAVKARLAAAVALFHVPAFTLDDMKAKAAIVLGMYEGIEDYEAEALRDGSDATLLSASIIRDLANLVDRI